ncbi:MAG: ATP-binding protein, partial [Planifilum fulgidum]
YTRSPHVADPFAELNAVSEARDGKVLEAIEERLPFFDTDLLDAVAYINRTCGLNWEVSRLKQELDRLAAEGRILRKESPFAVRYDVKR